MNQRRSFIRALAGVVGTLARPAPAIETLDGATGAQGAVLELRQYTIRRQRQGDFKQLFADQFDAPQVLAGIKVLGWFDDVDDCDRFVWMRSFPSMKDRADALSSFYSSEAWKAHRDEANAMIVDSDNVLLLQPASQQDAASLSREMFSGRLTVSITYLSTPNSSHLDSFFMNQVLPVVEAHDGSVVGRFGSYPGPNNFPRLPVRERESVYLSICRFGSDAAQAKFHADMRERSGLRDDLPESWLPDFMRKPEVLRLRS